MEFTLTQEQRMLRDMVRKLLEDQGGWQQFAQVGLLGLLVPESHGGTGGGAQEILIVMREIGRSLVQLPYASTAVVAASFLSRYPAGSPEASLLPRLISGQLKLAIAASAVAQLPSFEARAQPCETSLRLWGRQPAVVEAPEADFLLVSARTGHPGESGVCLVKMSEVPPPKAGFQRLDGVPCCDIDLRGLLTPESAWLGPDAEGVAASEALAWALDRGIAAACAQACGAMEQLLALTVEHLKTRRQFGRPLSEFQVLQHCLADMLISVEKARAAALLSAAHVDCSDARTRRRAVSASRVLVDRAARHVGEQAVQLHGALGMTDELPVGRHFKRLNGIAQTWGTTEQHLDRYAAHT